MKSLKHHPKEVTGQIGNYLRHEGVNDQSGIFFVVRIKAVDETNSISTMTADGSPRSRCDQGAYGPYAFHEWDDATGACVCGSTDPVDPATGTHLIAFNTLKFVNTIIDVYPHGIIGYLESTPESEEAQMNSWPHCSARTLQELFRLILEWDASYVYFGNRQPPAVVCHGITEALAIPSDIRTWLMSSIPPQKVEKFLKKDKKARSRTKGVPDMSDEFDDWVTGLLETSVGIGERHV